MTMYKNFKDFKSNWKPGDTFMPSYDTDWDWDGDPYFVVTAHACPSCNGLNYDDDVCTWCIFDDDLYDPNWVSVKVNSSRG